MISIKASGDVLLSIIMVITDMSLDIMSKGKKHKDKNIYSMLEKWFGKGI
jgi:oligoribonuclease (3'-5' exoribonuclease)